MMKPDYEGLIAAFPGADFIRGESMASHTTFRIGGPADLYLQPADGEELAAVCAEAARRGIPCLVVGKGSNLLVSDRGVRALVIQTGRLQELRLDGAVLTAGAGVSMARCASFACESGLSGLEFAHGIPGTLGGAVFMNAGAYGGEMAQVVRSVRIYRQGRIVTLENREMAFSYRHSALKDGEGTVLSAELALTPGDPAEILERIRDLDARRREKQPLEYPSAGSFFKRPEGNFAGALIERAGLKGCTVGGAQVSEKHAGFIINTGNATCGDVLALMDRVRDRVLETSGIRLEPEVLFVGEEA